ncbi:hypothetical protein K443DRAFT_106800 [Laccaria amethystina LaAM-08-1]|uniref:Uncharacterized protein n=1 Tax=Laccaria amethystina LaAM-08-1 TaxID=1095629 RepID=A0A0C9XKK5_9AGAR|nr:hypothetical protein K443DRAFT_106800 [Laccaria amethystina LaAM-08-1]
MTSLAGSSWFLSWSQNCPRCQYFTLPGLFHMESMEWRWIPVDSSGLQWTSRHTQKKTRLHWTPRHTQHKTGVQQMSLQLVELLVL